MTSRDTRKRLPPTSKGVADIFKLRFPQLHSLHRELSDTSADHLRTWQEMNRASGFDPDATLFLPHTLLSILAESVMASLTGTEWDSESSLSGNFASWVLGNEAGVEWVEELHSEVGRYDWRSSSWDVLRGVYQSLVDPGLRKAFGEFYTPDWLAVLVVDEVLDDDWCNRAMIDDGVAGVMDPACGSGGFLYHAARRILQSEAAHEVGINKASQTAVRLIVGSDINPIAVSMARVSLMRALPDGVGVKPSDLNIHQGDSLAIGKAPVMPKVDRIVANPPWVRMSNIQVEGRKRQLEGLIEELGISPGGKHAPGFDIGGLFVKRCRQLYTEGDDTAAGWVLNWASLKGGAWQRVRDDQEGSNREFWDLSEIKPPPFKGSKSCVWIQRGSGNTPALRVLRNKGHQDLMHTDTGAAFASKTSWHQVGEGLSQSPSEYMNGRSCEFKNGSNLFPNCLILISRSSKTDLEGVVRVSTQPSRHAPWSELGDIAGEVPEHYIRDVVISSKDLLAFAQTTRRTQAILPLTASGELDVDDGQYRNEFWRHLDELFTSNIALGHRTPDNLWDQLDYNGALSRQLVPKGEVGVRQKVAHNSSGQVVRAARIRCETIVSHSCFHYTASSEAEASFLVGMLNAPCMQSAYQGAMQTDRHFDQYIWHKVPIPRFNPADALHGELVAVTGRAEQVAEELVGMLPEDVKQLRASQVIRRALKRDGIADAIDDVVRGIMREHAVRAYGAGALHPW